MTAHEVNSGAARCAVRGARNGSPSRETREIADYFVRSAARALSQNPESSRAGYAGEAMVRGLDKQSTMNTTTTKAMQERIDTAMANSDRLGTAEAKIEDALEAISAALKALGRVRGGVDVSEWVEQLGAAFDELQEMQGDIGDLAANEEEQAECFEALCAKEAK